MSKHKVTVLTLALLAAALALLVTAPQSGQTSGQNKPDLGQIFDKRDVMVPMRDGVRLHTEIYTPKNSTEPLPFIFERTPYGLSDDERGFTGKFGSYQELIPEGYIFVFQDIRGRYGSEGRFVMLRDPRDKRDPKAIDESTDTYDTIDWLLANVPNHNGRVERRLPPELRPRVLGLDGDLENELPLQL